MTTTFTLESPASSTNDLLDIQPWAEGVNELWGAWWIDQELVFAGRGGGVDQVDLTHVEVLGSDPDDRPSGMVSWDGSRWTRKVLDTRLTRVVRGVAGSQAVPHAPGVVLVRLTPEEWAALTDEQQQELAHLG